MSSKKYYFCELCDYIGDTYYFHLTHQDSSHHKNKCKKYKENLKKDEYTLGLFRKILLDETCIEYKNTDELCEAIIMYLTNYKITYDQIKEIRDKNKEFEMKLINESNN
jgi:replication initiation and membrane attachment protein DnaB